MAIIINLVMLALVVASIFGLWKLFEKAGKPGWYVLIPILNVITMLELVGKPWWWFFGFIIPLVNIAVSIYVMVLFLKCFGKEDVTSLVLTMIFPYNFLPVMALDPAVSYRKIS